MLILVTKCNTACFKFPLHARNTYQKVISLDGEQFPKVAESYGGIGLEAKVAAVMGWGQITPLTEKKNQQYYTLRQPHHYILILHSL